MKERETDIIIKWMEGTLSGDEKKNFEQTPIFKKVERMLNMLNSFKAPEYNVEEGFEKLKAKLPHKSDKTPQGRSFTLMPWLSPMLKIAAILVLIVGGYFLISPEKPTKIKTLASQKTEVTLPDLSSVQLNASSQISYLKSGWEDNRKVVLAGEAFFKVAQGSRFDVQTDGGTVSVLGTQFNVKNRKGYFEVACYEGLVEVVSAATTVKLSAGNIFRIVNGVIAYDEVHSVLVPSWMRNESTFKSIPFDHVIRELERQHNVMVSTENVDTAQLFTGKFSNSDLTLALKSIANPFNLTYQVNGKKIVLYGSNK